MTQSPPIDPDRAHTSPTIDWTELVAQALEVRKRAYCPYSNFAVGAALLGASGRIYTGANVENRSYGVTVCAERSAVVAANALGERDFVALAIAADNTPPARPCGLCLETLTEFCPDLPIRLVNLENQQETTLLRQLQPRPFRFSE